MNTPPNNTTGKLSTSDFTEDPRVTACLDELKAKFTKENPLIISDVVDKDNPDRQYVNLVQKGGGVLGIALVGYTYILEKMEIRFLRLAGTSAGAINTALMTVTDEIPATQGAPGKGKSEQILEAICDLDFFSLVDGHPAARWLIKQFITDADFGARVSKWLKTIFMIGAFLVFGDIVLLGLQHAVPDVAFFTGLCFVLTGIYILVTGFLVSYGLGLLKRLKNAGYGINPGDFFYDWIKKQLKDNGVSTVSDLNKKAGQPTSKIRLRDGIQHPDDLEGLNGDVTFITSELVTQNKIQFPAMCDLFKPKAEIDKLQPAGFVRASMAIPVFFESYMINDIPCDDAEVKAAWQARFQLDTPPTSARFVDGGILSNFPINLFYNPEVITPRLPVFGIDLDDTNPNDKEMQPSAWSLGGYFGRMFNTIRYYYDKDFLIKNAVFERGIGRIPLAGYNWLNFFLKDQDKKDMFALGAAAARDFLLKFDWEEYKNARTVMQRELNSKSEKEAQKL